MTRSSSRTVVLPYQLPSDSIVYRMIPADSGWIAPDGMPDPAMFYRKLNDTDGVSVATTLEAGLERMRRVGRKVEGARSLAVGMVRDIEPAGKLDVRSKNAQNTHAAITGLPYQDDDVREAERLAGRLLDISENVPVPTT